MLPKCDAGFRRQSLSRVAASPGRGDSGLGYTKRDFGIASQMSGLRGGLCGSRHRHLDFFADRDIPTGDPCDSVLYVIGFPDLKTDATFYFTGN